MWFVSVLFFTVIVFKLLERLPLPALIAVAVVGLALGALYGPVLAALPLGVGSALPCVAYLIVGRVLRRVRDSVPAPAVIGAVLVVAGFAMSLTGVVPTVDIKYGDFGAPGMSFVVSCAISVGLVLVAEEAFQLVSPRVHAGTSLLARAGFTVVLLHPLFLWSPTPTVGDFAMGLVLPCSSGSGRFGRAGRPGSPVSIHGPQPLLAEPRQHPMARGCARWISWRGSRCLRHRGASAGTHPDCR